MDSVSGEFLIRWTVRASVACYLCRVFLELFGKSSLKREQTGRWVWSVGCLLYLVHVASAFHFAHDWSHAEAYRHTAERTAEVVGMDWGGGLYFNYLFTLLWMADAALWWTGKLWVIEKGSWFWTVQIFLAFMVFNATVVFGPAFWRWVGMLVLAAAVPVLWLKGRERGKSE